MDSATIAARDEAIASIRETAARLEAHGWDVWPAHRRVSAALAATSEDEMVEHVRAAQDVLSDLADRHVRTVA